MTTTMMNKKLILLSIGLIAVVLSSCSKFLDPYPNGQRTDQDLWKYPEMVQGLLGYIYNNYIPKNYDNNEGAYLECATDNAVSTSRTRDMTKFALNSITTGQDPFLTYWDRDYKAIASVNTFLKDHKGYKTRYLVVPHLDTLVRQRLEGESFALRAWFEWDLLQKFGGKGVDGRMLGVPIVTDTVDINMEGVNLARNTYDECVRQIVRDCDSAYKYLPIAYRDFLVSNAADLAYAGSMYWARIDGITTMAIKSDVYLTWASPRFNPDNDLSRWDSAAYYAKKVMDFKLNVDGTGNTSNPQKSGAFTPSMAINWVNPQAPEIVWVSQYASNSSMESMFYPGGFGGSGTMGATQELVDSYGMKNGYPITDPRSNYDPANPYLNRDPRFYSTIFYNNSQAMRLSNNQAMYTFESWYTPDGLNNGKDLADATSKNSRTNYYIKKFVYMGWNPTDKTVDTQRHSKFYMRWEKMVLNFAEAANHVVASPTDASKYGLSPKDAIKYLRTRKTTDGANGLSATDPYLDEVASNTDSFDKLVKNERRIALCFEGNRFFDLRRWSTTLDELNQSVHGVSILKNANNSFTYDFNVEVEKRSFPSAYIPIPYSEMLRMSKLVQNEGWTTWE